ncbi:hypothetical protein GCK72_007854 [Caenorhabditis remanei]|uniref:EF-hand domain-containing protein n=1 Tax=Caenorhabditis remanei TaxID=31234 RepID=A0A6A5HK55_CAERE|nr:hypothetical protein GCK72_007854 [Caenorhabditis remanei]KAF1767895.1 hypothetical protein GCK72_007854 [Caenorhabditis remanei]
MTTSSSLFYFLLIGLTVAAPVPLPLEEDFNVFHTKQENHEQRFLRVDQNKDKVVTFDEFLHMELAYVDAKKEEFDTLDKNHDGKVSLAEYEEHFHEASSKNEKSRTAYFAKVFEDFDEDFNMALSRDELERVLAERFLVKPRENFPKLFFKFDVDKSGGLDLTEYMKFDAEFPFDQTDPVGGAPSKANSHDDQMHTEVPQDADAAAIAAVLAQASPTLNKSPAGAVHHEGPGLHPVAPGAFQPAVPIKKV